MLLAVDLGLRTGLALFGADGRLVWYRSQNFGTSARLRRAVQGIIESLPDLRWIVIEGGGNLARIWEKEADRRGIAIRRISAEVWRASLLLDREQRRAGQAKEHAERLARRVIEWSSAPRPTALRHDTAEAILIGFWGVLELELIPELPRELRR